MPERADRSTPANNPPDTITDKDREIDRLRRQIEQLDRERSDWSVSGIGCVERTTD